MIRVELHCHTHHSRDSLMTADQILRACDASGLDRIAITDHNTIAGAREAAALDPARVILGEEILTTEGELLAYFVTEEVPAGLTPEETIARLRGQGAVISVAHPFDAIRQGSWQEEGLTRILPLVDAVEVFNARTWSRRPNRQAADLAREHALLATAGSDAHAPSEIGRAVLRLPDFSDANTFLQALGRAEIEARRSPPYVHFFSRCAVWRKAMGWSPPG